MHSDLVYRLMNYLSGYGRAVMTVMRHDPFDMSFVALEGDLGKFVPDFICNAIDDVDPENVVYIGPRDYSGTLPCRSYVATNLMELDHAVNEIDQKPQVLLLEFDHLREDAERAAHIIASRMIDHDMWPQQLTVMVVKPIVCYPPADTTSRLMNPRTADAKEANVSDYIPR
ncbi:hypothetical protein pEaSNUABM25_00216 [Erwinia phage pEa_SNUABM_25]|nr:hypothetical protein pEaSNUABM25_00216 [Erwinia phage pEa_SNUABM_25]